MMQPMDTAPRDGTYFLMYQENLVPVVVNWPEGCALGVWCWYINGWRGQSINRKGVGWIRLPEDKVTEWRPIESIPKGGNVLVGARVDGQWLAWVASFDGLYSDLTRIGLVGEYGDEPTHWMPYPEGPK